MKKFKISKTIIHMFGICLVAFANIICNSASVGLWGEIDPPDSLMK